MTNRPELSDQQRRIAKLHTKFRNQHGAASDSQVRSAGVTLRQQQRLLDGGFWCRAATGVLISAGAPNTWHLGASVAVLAAQPSAALSHGAAARLYGFDGYDSYDSLHITVGHGARPSPTKATQHVLVGHGPGSTFTHDGIRAVTAPLAVLGCLVLDGRERAAQALDSALRLGRSPRWFIDVAGKWRSRGRRGPAELIDLVAERTDKRLPRSWFQRLAHRALAEAGVHLAEEHPVVDDHGVLIAELDLADEEWRIGVECQSWRWHATPGAQRADAHRRRALRRLGWEIVDVWWSDLERIDEVVATITTIRSERSGRQFLARTTI